MRLWHKDLIDVLPRKQLLGQWRELNSIYKQIKEKGKVKHSLVNYVNDDYKSFLSYTYIIIAEMIERGYKVSEELELYKEAIKMPSFINYDEIFKDRHNVNYLLQCAFNLDEKHDCGLITNEEMTLITSKVCMYLKEQGFFEKIIKKITGI